MSSEMLALRCLLDMIPASCEWLAHSTSFVQMIIVLPCGRVQSARAHEIAVLGPIEFDVCYLRLLRCL